MTIAEVTKKYAEMIKMKKQNQFMKLEDIAKKLPGYESSTPGFPLEPPLVPAELQFYFHSPRTERHTPIHFLHEKYIMLFCIRGNRQIELDGKACRLHPNDFLLIPPACNHANNMPPTNPDMNQDYDYAILYASFLLPDCGKKLKSLVRQVFPLRYSEVRLLRKSTEQFLECYAGDNFAGMESAFSFGLFLMRLLERRFQAGQASRNYVDKNILLLERIQSYMFAHLRKGLTIREIARELGVSPSLLRLTFRKEMKVSLGRYIQTRIMHKIEPMLRSTDMSVSEIAAEMGYQTESSLIRAFKRESGMTPQQFRRHKRSQE